MAYRTTESTRQARADRSRALLDAASSIVAESGFRAASVKAVSALAGVSAGTVYTYFDTREHLLAEVFREHAAGELLAVREAVDAVEHAGATAQLGALVETFARRAVRGRRLAWALLVEPVDELIDSERLRYRRAYADTLEAIVRRGVASGDFAAQDARVSGAGLTGAIGEALTGPLSPLDAGEVTTDELVSSILAFCLRSVGATEAGR